APGLTWGQKSYTFSAQSSWVTVFLRGRSTKTPDKGRSAYVWIDDAQVVAAPPTDGTPTALGVGSIRWQWSDLAIETGYRVKDTSGTDLSGLLPADTTQWDETNGLAPNTQYTRRVYAVTACGESGPSAGMSRYSLIETPAGVAIGAVSTTSITVNPLGAFSNLTAGSSGLLTLNTTAGTNSGWTQSQSPWLCSALTANTPYRFVARARNGDAVETPDSPAVWKWTLSIPPAPGSITPSDAAPCVNSPVVWTPAAGFGAGSVQSYRWAWDQSPTHVWTGEEPVWSSGTIETIPSAPGTWYLHVQGCNGENVANGTYEYAVNARAGTTITQQPAPQQVPAGGTAVFTVAATGDGTLSYQWQKNGVSLGDDGHYSGTSTPALTITGVTVGDAAGYGCVVGGACGQVASNAAALTVLAATADFDGDGDVDLSDFAVFQACFNGPNQSPREPGCLPADFDGDADVDLADFAVFQSCFGGPNRPPRCG
ncbi:MAG: immunoglobulin domain-containing protein, partial [Phycisphaerae bacterium]